MLSVMTNIRGFRLLLPIALGVTALPASPLRGQTYASIVGTVRTVEGEPLSYTGVAIPSEGRDRLSSDKGAFSFSLLPSGPLRMRFRHVGFTPVDTQVILTAGDSLRVEVTMKRLAVRLEGMRVTAYCAAADSLSGGGEESRDLALILDQIRQAAAQFKTLVNIYPFSKTMGYTNVERMKDGSYDTGRPDLVEIDATDEANYKRGRVFRSIRGRQRLVFPTLLDFADKEFLVNHCFSYGGDAVVDSNLFVKILFTPVQGLKDPDIEGTVTLRASDFGLVAVEMKATAIPKSWANEIKSFRVVTHFREIFPGIPVASTVESFIAPGPRVEKMNRDLATRGELQVLELIRWKSGPP